MDSPKDYGHDNYKPIGFKKRVWFRYEIRFSIEYRSLSAKTRDVYEIFLYKRDIKTRNGKPYVKNNCNIVFTEQEAVEKWKFEKKA